jgi:uncharacterized membrane protein YccF (DUF307 family)
MKIEEKYRSRKFLLALIASIVSSIALFTIDFSGATWVSAQSIILGLYGAANVTNKKVTTYDSSNKNP